MIILQANKFHWLKGGSETAYFGLINLLEERGHKVIPFSMKDEKNLPTHYSRFFVEKVDYEKAGLSSKISSALKIIYSFDAAGKMRALLNEVRPDIAHFHIFQHQISPSVFGPLKKKGVPIILTLHDLKPICPNYKMFTGGHICEECKGGRFYKCFTNKCTKNSAFKSLINMFEMYLHYTLGYYQNVDRYITVSAFYREKMIEAGFSPERVVHIPNFIDCSGFTPSQADNGYGVYFGRLSEEKGLTTLLDALSICPDMPFLIVGSGPLELQLKDHAAKLGLKKVKFPGFKKGDELKKIIMESSFTVLPSEWYENCPMSILESLAMGKPVIGARIGGITELIKEGVDGLTFASGDPVDLSAKMKDLWRDSHIRATMGAEGRKKIERDYSPGLFYDRVMDIYKGVL